MQNVFKFLMFLSIKLIKLSLISGPLNIWYDVNVFFLQILILNLLFHGFGLSSGCLKIILVLYTMSLQALSFYRHILTLRHVKKDIKLKTFEF